MVYAYYFQTEVFCEFAASGHHFTQPTRPTVKLRSNAVSTSDCICTKDTKRDDTMVVRVSRLLGKYSIVQGLHTNWLASVYALNLVCNQIHAETLPFLYNRTVFIFASPRRITNFLNVIPGSKLQHITKLRLHYSTYGAPENLQDIIWQDKYTEAWKRALKTASKTLLNLQNLELWVQVSLSPLRLNLREQWVKPLLQFRRLNKLKTVNVHVRSQWSKGRWATFEGNKELAKASWDLHELFGRALSLAILGAKEAEAMAEFNTAWEVTYRRWQYSLGYAKIGW